MEGRRGGWGILGRWRCCRHRLRCHPRWRPRTGGPSPKSEEVREEGGSRIRRRRRMGRSRAVAGHSVTARAAAEGRANNGAVSPRHPTADDAPVGEGASTSSMSFTTMVPPTVVRDAKIHLKLVSRWPVGAVDDLHRQLTEWAQASGALHDVFFDEDGSRNEDFATAPGGYDRANVNRDPKVCAILHRSSKSGWMPWRGLKSGLIDRALLQ